MQPETTEISKATGQEAAGDRAQPTTQSQLAESDLERIVGLSGLQSHPRQNRIPVPSEVVRYSGRQYKVRAYPDSEAARRRLEVIGPVEHLFARCFGRLDRYLVFEYINGRAAGGNELKLQEQMLAAIPAFLAELAMIRTNDSLHDDFDFLCKRIELAHIFRPRTIELVRRYYSQAQSLPVAAGVEYYDPMPRNFILTEEGKLVSIDEKHLRIGPRGVSLIKPLEQLPEAGFSKFKADYLAKLGLVPFDHLEYQQFLRFYRHMTALAMIFSYRVREINLYEASFHWSRRTVLGIVGVSPSTNLAEEAPWLRYWWREAHNIARCAPGSLKRRLIRLMARVRDYREGS